MFRKAWGHSEFVPFLFHFFPLAFNGPRGQGLYTPHPLVEGAGKDQKYEKIEDPHILDKKIESIGDNYLGKNHVLYLKIANLDSVIIFHTFGP